MEHFTCVEVKVNLFKTLLYSFVYLHMCGINTNKFSIHSLTVVDNDIMPNLLRIPRFMSAGQMFSEQCKYLVIWKLCLTDSTKSDTNI